MLNPPVKWLPPPEHDYYHLAHVESAIHAPQELTIQLIDKGFGRGS